MAGGQERGLGTPIHTHPLVTQARTLGNPVIDGDSASFIWEGRTPPRMLDDLTNWDEVRPFERLASGIWKSTLTLPLNAYVEYALFDPQTGGRLTDPFNPKRVSNGINAWNHYFYMPKGKPSPFVLREPGVVQGTLTRHVVATDDLITGRQRSVMLYHPPVEGPVPLMVVFDGTDYLRHTRLNVIMDNLIAHKRIRPFAMALLQNGRQARLLEYACSDATLGFVIERILPLARSCLDLSPSGLGGYGVMGASMGGLMALYSGLRLPQVFGKVLSQSGAYRIPEHEFVTFDLVRHLPKPDLDIWMDVGRFDSLLECNREMRNLLDGKGYRVTYREFSAGHNYTAWRDDVARGFEILFKPE